MLLAKACAEELSDKNGLSISLLNLGLLGNLKGNYSLAIEYFEQALLFAEEIEQTEFDLVLSLEGWGVSLGYLGKYEEAKKCWTRGLEVLRGNELN